MRVGFFTLLLGLFLCGAVGADDGPVSSRIENTAGGDLILIHEVRINAPLAQVWEAYTSEDGWRAWVAPVVAMDFRVGGEIKTQYDASKAIGDEGTITLYVRGYAPERWLTLQAEIRENWPQFSAEEQANLSNTLTFESDGQGGTLLTSYATGYRDNQKHRQLAQMFRGWNAAAYLDLIRWVESGERKSF